jgi:hypothetical protein
MSILFNIIMFARRLHRRTKHKRQLDIQSLNDFLDNSLCEAEQNDLDSLDAVLKIHLDEMTVNLVNEDLLFFFVIRQLSQHEAYSLANLGAGD